MPYSFNPFSGNFDNTPSTLKGDSAYSTVLPNSAVWTDGYQTGTVYKANSASYATIDFTNDKFFPLSGGLITGNTRINGNVTIFGDLTSTGTQTFANTIFTTTSSLSIVHVGTGPAFWVGNNGSGDIASFNDIDQGIEVLHIGGANGDFPNVGVKTSAPNKDFTVNGEISASNTIWDANGNSNQWNSAYSTVQSNSATNWNYQGTDLKGLSSSWQNTYTVYSTNSASYATQNYLGSNFLPLSGGTITGELTAKELHVEDKFTVSTGSATLFIESGRIGINTEVPTQALTVFGNISATGTLFVSGGNSNNWNSSYNTVQSNSATNWNYQGTDLKDLSSGWVGGNTAFTNLVSNSAAYLSSVDLSFLSVSANWNSVYSTVQSNSASDWNYQGTDLKDLSATWQNTYTDYSTNSASYATVNFVDSKFLPLTGGTLNGSITATDGSFDNLYVSQEDAGPAVLYASDYKVGINTETPNEALTVVGSISATNTIYTNYLELSDVKFTNEHLTNVSSLTASNDFLKVIVGTNIKYLRLYDVE